MSEQLIKILMRIDSRHLAKLWLFYRDYFQNDVSCLQFFSNIFENEPVNDGTMYHELDEEEGGFVNEAGNIIYDSMFIPRRMLNSVERLVMAARDMENIRRGKDIFKIVYIVTCVETLQILCGKNTNKKDMLFDFFEEYTSEADKKYISDHFMHDDEDTCASDDSFIQFIGVLNEYRNCAAHEGEYFGYCFNNNYENTYPVQLILKIDLKNFSLRNKKEHTFYTTISYKEFEKIFVRTCIEFIDRYLKNK